MLSSRRQWSSRKPKPRNLSRHRLNRLASKHLLKHPLAQSPDHNSINHTNNSNRFLALKGGAGPSPPKES
ncbi:MAG TPA: hypothetical protein VKA82_08350 [Rubrobacter sp.]|nr:hypothetical protein [Rubrobacter sp.]